MTSDCGCPLSILEANSTQYKVGGRPRNRAECFVPNAVSANNKRLLFEQNIPSMLRMESFDRSNSLRRKKQGGLLWVQEKKTGATG